MIRNKPSTFFLISALFVAILFMNFTDVGFQQVQLRNKENGRSILVRYGAQIFQRENCLDCHTLRVENESSRRISLDGYGGTRGDLYLFKFLQDPKSIGVNSHQFGYTHLFTNKIDDKVLTELILQNDSRESEKLATYQDSILAQAENLWKKMDNRYSEEYKNCEALALVAFLQHIPPTAKQKRLDSIAYEEYKVEFAPTLNVLENADSLVQVSILSPEQIKAGNLLFQRYCSVCHNSNAKGVNGSGPNLIDNESIYGDDPQSTAYSIIYGRSGGMPEHQKKLTAKQILRLLTFLEDKRRN